MTKSYEREHDYDTDSYLLKCSLEALEEGVDVSQIKAMCEERLGLSQPHVSSQPTTK